MVIRISKTVEEHRTVLKVDGRLKAADLQELTRAYESGGRATALDLSELQSADRDGVAYLRKLVSEGVEVRKASPYIELLIRKTL